MRRWVFIHAGLTNAAGFWYLLWSGIVGDIGLLFAGLAWILHAVVTYRHANCEVHRCWRIGRHATAAGRKVCRHHHPTGAPSHQDVIAEHYAALGQPVPAGPAADVPASPAAARADGCPFCERIADGFYDRDRSLPGMFAVFEPLRPVTPGHLLVVPWQHFPDAAARPYAAGQVLEHAAEIARDLGEDANLITSIGADATQTVWHMHAHVVPRRAGDGLHLPWTGQTAATTARPTPPGGTP